MYRECHLSRFSGFRFLFCCSSSHLLNVHQLQAPPPKVCANQRKRSAMRALALLLLLSEVSCRQKVSCWISPIATWIYGAWEWVSRITLKVTISYSQTTNDVDFMKSSPLGCFSRGWCRWFLCDFCVISVAERFPAVTWTCRLRDGLLHSKHQHQHHKSKAFQLHSVSSSQALKLSSSQALKLSSSQALKLSLSLSCWSETVCSWQVGDSSWIESFWNRCRCQVDFRCIFCCCFFVVILGVQCKTDYCPCWGCVKSIVSM